MKFLRKALELVTGKPAKQLPGILTERQLIEFESKIGRQLFGPIPAGHSRDFFCLDASTWVWHEEWRDLDNKPQSSTLRYEVQPGGILKVQPGHVYKYIEGEELKNLAIAVRLYYERCSKRIYGLDPVTGRPLGEISAPTQMPPATIYS